MESVLVGNIGSRPRRMKRHGFRPRLDAGAFFRQDRGRTMGHAKTILLVEDDEILSSGLAFTLEREGYRVTRAARLAHAEKALATATFDLIVLDVMLPDGSGYDLCTSVRRRSGVPIIFLTARDEEVDAVRGLETGGDDYVTKPFRLKELTARIKAALRRAEDGPHESAVVKSGPITIDLAASRVYRGTEEIRLSAGELRLLALLAGHPGQTLTRVTIMERLMDSEEPFVDDNTLSVYIRRLREKLEDDPSEPARILTVRGIGYRWEEPDAPRTDP
jgi:two-component system response regulator RegX3